MFNPGDRVRAFVHESKQGPSRIVELVRPWEWPGKSLWLVKFVDETWMGSLLYDEDKFVRLPSDQG